MNEGKIYLIQKSKVSEAKVDDAHGSHEEKGVKGGNYEEIIKTLKSNSTNEIKKRFDFLETKDFRVDKILGKKMKIFEPKEEFSFFKNLSGEDVVIIASRKGQKTAIILKDKSFATFKFNRFIEMDGKIDERPRLKEGYNFSEEGANQLIDVAVQLMKFEIETRKSKIFESLNKEIREIISSLNAVILNENIIETSKRENVSVEVAVKEGNEIKKLKEDELPEEIKKILNKIKTALKDE
ncbi:hypothetical protein [Persephonella sp.]